MGTALLDPPLLDGEYIPLDLEDDEDTFDDEHNSNDLAGLATISNNNRPGQGDEDVYERSGLSRRSWMPMQLPT